MEFYKQGMGLLGVVEKVRRSYVNLAFADCGTQAAAAKRLKITQKTLWLNIHQRGKKQIEYNSELP